MSEAQAVARRTEAAAARAISLRRRFMRYRFLYVLLAPVLVYFVIFHYIPMYGVAIAFQDFSFVKGIFGSRWVGLEHFARFVTNYNFLQILRNTLVISVLRIVIEFPAAILLALLINEVQNLAFKKTVQTVLYLPYFMSWVVISGLIVTVFSPTIGVVRLFGNRHIMMDPKLFRPILIVSSIWKNSGYGCIVYLAAIAGINPELYESAAVEGCGRLRLALHVTLPSIIPVVLVLFILGLAGILNAGFEQVFNLTNSYNHRVSEIIDTYVYRMGLVTGEYSFATAVGLFKSAIGLVLVLGANAIISRTSGGEQGIW